MGAKLDRFNNIKGFLHPDEGKFLYELSSEECRERFAVEIGSYCGKSACYIGLACKENDTKLFSIDHHRGSEEQQFGEEYFDEEIYDYEKKRVDTYPLFISNIKKFDLIDTVIPVIDNSVEASKRIVDDLDLVFIDGSHTFESARNDYFSWRGKIKEASKSYERVSNIDFFPTIQNIIGYKNKDLKLDGIDLNPIFDGRKIEKRALFYHFPIYLQAYNVQEDNGTDPLFRTRPGSVIIEDNWKLHHYFENDKKELYNIENDVSESYDLSKVNVQKTTELFNSLNLWREANNAPIPFEKNIKYDQKFVDSINLLIIDGKLSGRINTNW